MVATVLGPESLKCPLCGSLEIVRNEIGDYVCLRCGTIVLEASEVELDSFEGYGADNKKRDSRGALTNTLHDKGLGSQIRGKGDRRIRRLSKIQDRIKFGNEQESFLGDVKKGIDQFSSLITRTLGSRIPRYIIDDAYMVSDVLYEYLPKRYRKTSIEFRRLVGLATLLAVIKEHGSYLPPEVVLNNLDLDPKTKKLVKDMYTLIHNDIIKKRNMNKRKINDIAKFKEIANATLNFLKNKTGVEPERDTLVLEAVEKMLVGLKKANKDKMGSRFMSSYIGGAMYLALRILATSQRAMLTQETIAKVLGRGPNALRSMYVEMLNKTLIVVEVPAKPPRNKSRRRRAR